jgi:lysophospholipase L1-like esterase
MALLQVRPDGRPGGSRAAGEPPGNNGCQGGCAESVCDEHGSPLADICSRLHDEHFGDNLHPNAEGAKIIAEQVFAVLRSACGQS